MLTNEALIFTSESVSEGHPDKVADQISDSILDLYLKEDPTSKVACETLVTTHYCVIAGEVSSQANISHDKIENKAREIIKKIGYNNDDLGFNADTVKIDVRLHQQSPDIAQGVNLGAGLFKEEGAGDQGMMFGFAINETKELMPMPIYYSHLILKELSHLRHSKKIHLLLPDAKSQVSVKYENKKPVSIETIVVSTQHLEGATREEIEEAVVEQCIKKILPKNLLKNTKFYINPTGRFVIGGPYGDCGLTGRKIIVDTYGGFARHGGGAFSGKDPSKVDRSAAYIARYVAKNIVAAELAEICEIQLSYAIGVAEPISICINTYGTGKMKDIELEKKVKSSFNLTPQGIRDTLNLRNISYLPTSTYGHFGRSEDSFTWEKCDAINNF